MRVIDMNLNPLTQPDLDQVLSITTEDLTNSCKYFAAKFADANVERGVMVVLNPNFMNQPDVDLTLKNIQEDRKFIISYATDFRAIDSLEQLERSHSLGVRILKFHPYLQKIEVTDFPKCGIIAKHAESLKMIIMVCCSYGTRALDRYSGVRLSSYLSEQVSCPIVMSHAGGAQILDAMLVATDTNNLYLETSFSLPNYIGSSIETDFAFAMRKLGTHRWMYGSDAPFVDFNEALSITLDFFERHHFSPKNIKEVLYDTAATALAQIQ